MVCDNDGPLPITMIGRSRWDVATVACRDCNKIFATERIDCDNLVANGVSEAVFVVDMGQEVLRYGVGTPI
jgi:hypothetical protein